MCANYCGPWQDEEEFFDALTSPCISQESPKSRPESASNKRHFEGAPDKRQFESTSNKSNVESASNNSHPASASNQRHLQSASNKRHFESASGQGVAASSGGEAAHPGAGGQAHEVLGGDSQPVAREEAPSSSTHRGDRWRASAWGLSSAVTYSQVDPSERGGINPSGTPRAARGETRTLLGGVSQPVAREEARHERTSRLGGRDAG